MDSQAGQRLPDHSPLAAGGVGREAGRCVGSDGLWVTTRQERGKQAEQALGFTGCVLRTRLLAGKGPGRSAGSADNRQM